MRRFLTISAGRCAADAVPIVSSSDPGVVAAALTAIHQRLASEDEECGRPIPAFASKVGSRGTEEEAP